MSTNKTDKKCVAGLLLGLIHWFIYIYTLVNLYTEIKNGQFAQWQFGMGTFLVVFQLPMTLVSGLLMAHCLFDKSVSRAVRFTCVSLLLLELLAILHVVLLLVGVLSPF